MLNEKWQSHRSEIEPRYIPHFALCIRGGSLSSKNLTIVLAIMSHSTFSGHPMGLFFSRVMSSVVGIRATSNDSSERLAMVRLTPSSVTEPFGAKYLAKSRGNSMRIRQSPEV